MKKISLSLLVITMAISLLAQTPDSLWYKAYGDVLDDMGFDAIEAEDGGYIVIGKTEVDENNTDAYVAKFDNNGDIIWENTRGFPG